MPSSGLQKHRFDNIPLLAGDTSEYLQLIRKYSEANHASVFHLVNAYTCAIFGSQVKSNPLVDEMSVNLIDGYWLRKHLELKTGNRIKGTRGPELFERSFSPDLPVGERHFLLGTTPENLTELERKLLVKSSGKAMIRGLSLPFRPLSSEEEIALAEVIVNFRPNVVWIALGTPKQDLVAQELCRLINVPIVCVGAAFDFISGAKKTAPIWMQKFGLEWLFRLASEPRRLWKRYLLGNLKFLFLAARDRSSP